MTQFTTEDVEACRAGRIACAGERKMALEDGRIDDAREWERQAHILDALVAKLSARSEGGEGTHDCPACHGRGQVGNEIPGEPCDRCGGFGVVPRAALSPSPRAPEGEPNPTEP